MSIQNLQETISPYFTEDVVHDIVKKFTGFNNFKISKVNIKNDTKKGDSYLSSLTKLSVEACEVTNSGEEPSVLIPIIVKAIPKNEARRKTFRSSDFFETEIYFYEKVWPLLKSFKKTKITTDEDDEVPALLASFSDGLNDFLALEDISYKGYATANREGSVSYEETIMGLKTLAKFHALSVAVRESDSKFAEIASGLKETYFAPRLRPWNMKYQRELFRVFRDAATKELPEIYLEKFNKLFSSDLYGTVCGFTSVRNKLTAVTEGDAWIPNFLFKSSDKKPYSCVVIDFQLARYSTLSNDLSFFMFACVQEDLLDSDWDKLVRIYYDTFCTRLEQLGMPRKFITLEELNEDLKKHTIFGFAMAMDAKSRSLLTEEEIPNIEEIQGIEEVPLENLFIPHFQDNERNHRLATMVKFFIDHGFIDQYI